MYEVENSITFPEINMTVQQKTILYLSKITGKDTWTELRSRMSHCKRVTSEPIGRDKATRSIIKAVRRRALPELIVENIIKALGDYWHHNPMFYFKLL